MSDAALVLMVPLAIIVILMVSLFTAFALSLLFGMADITGPLVVGCFVFWCALFVYYGSK